MSQNYSDDILAVLMRKPSLTAEEEKICDALIRERAAEIKAADESLRQLPVEVWRSDEE